MGLYKSRILPRILDLAMRNEALDPYRHKIIGSARGLVLEVGVGSGMNLPLSERAVDSVYGLDPTPELLDLARQRAREAAVLIFLVRASAEEIPFATSVFDTVIMTWTLCSIPKAHDSARRDTTGAQIRWAVDLRRARPFAGNWCRSMAASTYSVLELG